MSGAIRLTVDDHAISDRLHDEWQTVAQIRGRLESPISSDNLIASLQRLTAAGIFEHRAHKTLAPRRGRSRTGEPLTILMFRRAQPR
jgi:hypothetical protein